MPGLIIIVTKRNFLIPWLTDVYPDMITEESTGCSPDKCDSCTGCGGTIEKISLKVEWRHKGTPEEMNREIEESIYTLSSDLAVSGVEVIFINNTYSPDISEGSSEFFINGHRLDSLTSVQPEETVTREVLRKGIFQALLQNI
jgi:hypothetical protein